MFLGVLAPQYRFISRQKSIAVVGEGDAYSAS
jgi:hypothetical protein